MEGENNINNLRVASFSCYLNTPDETILRKLTGAIHQDPHSTQEPPFRPISSGRTKTLTTNPTSNTNLLHSMNSEDNFTNLRVASFSSYLNTTEDNFVFKIPGVVHDPTAIISSQETPCPIGLGRTKTKEGEISIFGADKYFNMKMEYDSRNKYGQKKEGYTDLNHLKPNFKLGTVSVSSEGSSLNSQTALLSNLHRNPSQSKEKRVFGRKFFNSFGCNGRCSDKKDVYISVEHGILHGRKQSQPGLKTGEQLAFPIRSPVMENSTVKNQFKEDQNDEEEEDQRRSIEVFGSDTRTKRDIASNLERKLSVLTWDAIPKAQNLPTTSFGSTTVCDDMASDASSDLFEIENISGTTVYPLLTRQASDRSSCTSPTTQYAPSEASIQWSVVTASAADFSAASDFENVERDTVNKSVRPQNNVGKDGEKGRSGGLLSCRSYKAVRVAETAYKITEKPKQEALDSSFSFRKLQGDQIRVKDVESPRILNSLESRGLFP
ncbi:unnamed protein product [Ilex paraguariensis]|uniref:Uncharacterized protein n=1 Tax=Ilex paraguariensis TaxID=185542 RepID=A0ABC8SNG4_9AQUA